MTKIWTSFTSLFTLLDYVRKYNRIKSDTDRMRTEWQRIGGINASTGELFNFANDFSLTLMEYAKWTETTLDDQVIALVHNVLIDYRGTLIDMIDWLRKGHVPNTTELLGITESVCVSPNEYGDPLTVLSILLTLYQALKLLKKQETDTVPPTPDTIPPERKRPVITFIRKILGKQ